ncbi:MAG: hypothetical protein IH620_07370 [Ignavibacterium sp.]|nr:hypothetical protein [Ignavibacterium sp.]
MSKYFLSLISLINIFLINSLFAQNPVPQMGGDFRPNYESYSINNFIEENETSYSGNLMFSIPLLTVPGRHGHNFDIKLNYNSDIKQKQVASWVGLGWNLEIGSIERTVNGRTDEPFHNSNYGSLGQDNSGTSWRGNLGGRFKYNFTIDTLEKRDIADYYQLSIDNGGMEIIPFSVQMDDSMIVNYPPITFLTLQYKPWNIQAFLDQNQSAMTTFEITKEDGTNYTFGGDNFGSIEWLKVTEPYNPNFYQRYQFPYRWNLSKIKYPDGSSTNITYDFQNGPSNMYFRRHESVIIDRSDINNNKTGNYFGNISPSGLQPDWTLYEYTHPTSLETDTHYLVFETSSGTAINHDSTNRNCRLDAIILYEKGTNTELKRIVFHYAESNNSNAPWHNPIQTPANSAPEWEDGDRLNNDQLTLTGFTIQNGEYLPPENLNENYADYQNYHFSYTTNPKMDIEGLETWGYVLPNETDEWPGYYYPGYLYTNNDIVDAWRLKTIILPTGGKYTFNYDTEVVRYDPEGNYIGEPNDGWNYSSEPRCILKSKEFEDGFNSSSHIWNYTYSPEVIFDPPSGAYESSYIPKMYRSLYLNRSDQYYKWMRGCSVGHRWVMVTNPDSSWKKIYYTSSYHGNGYVASESKPDIISTTLPTTLKNIIINSKAGCRGIIWKEETASQVNQYYYSYILQGALKDRYDYFNILSNFSNSEYTLRTSYWPRLDSVQTILDDVSNITVYEYNPTEREDADGNGLMKLQVDRGNDFDKRTTFKYAYSKFSQMGNYPYYMKSQLYSKTISKMIGSSVDDESKEFTTWNIFSGHYLPHQIYKWRGSSTDITAPDNPTSNDIAVKTFNYDSLGYCNATSIKDANGLVTKYYYSDDINYPFVNNEGGLQKGYVSGIEYPQSSPPLKKSYRYDQFANITHIKDENGNITKATYDELGRITSVIDPLDNETENFAYYMPSDNNLISPSDPNSITEKSYRSQNDFTLTKYFYDGAGYERQKVIAIADSNIIFPTAYDNMWRVNRTYRPYGVNLGNDIHFYDSNFYSNDTAYYHFAIPYKTNEYYIDGSGRLKNLKPEGEAWQSHFLSYSYGKNGINYSNVSVLADGPDMLDTTHFTALYDQTATYSVVARDGGYFCVGTTPLGYNVVPKIYSNNTGAFHTVPGVTYYLTAFTSSCLPPPKPCTVWAVGHVQYNFIEDVSGYYSGTLRKTSSNDENGIESLKFQDRLGNLVQTVTNSTGLKLITKFEYDVLGNMTKSTPPKGSIYATNFTFNTLNQLVEKSTPDADTVKYLYDKAGNLRFSKDAKQKTVNKFTYSKYDALNRITEIGEYNSSAGFTTANAEDVTFPLDSDPNKTITKKVYFDNTYYMGQRNTLGKPSKTVAYRQGSIVQTTYFSFNETGLVEWLLKQIPNLQDVKISYWYDFQGNVTKKCVYDAVNGSVYTFYEYDAAGRLNKIFSNLADSEVGKVKEAEYTYNADGTINRLQLANAQGMDYVYNNRGWLNQINHQNLNTSQDPGHDGPGGTGVAYIDKFSELMGYENQDHIAGGTGFTFQPQYNGNISWMIMRTMGAGLNGVNAGISDPIIGYVYNYDNANRLTKADFGYYHTTSGWSNSLPKAAMYDLPSVSYDPDGNILNLQRKGINALMMDNFNYTYQSNKNRLASITNAVNSQTYNYTYDNNGSVTSDQYRGISNITYNINNLPEELLNSQSLTVQYTYDENNNRIRKLQTGSDDEHYILGIDGQTESVFDANGKAKFYNITNGGEIIGRMTPPINNLTLTNTTLVGNYQASNSITAQTNVVVNGTATLKTPGTIYLKPGFTANSGCNLTISVGAVTSDKYYYLKDHLGSIRVVVDTVGEIISYDDYDAWGMILNGRSSNFGFADDKYKFTGKELDTETGYFHFGARAYDGRIGRWNVIDPLFEKYPNVSPYNYALNNPLRFIDPKGMEAVDATPDDPDDKKKKQQETTINYIKQVGETFEKGFELIADGVSETANTVSTNLKSGAKSVLKSTLNDGPAFLNELSSNVMYVGIFTSIGLSIGGQPEIGALVIGTAASTSTKIDIAATGLTLFNYGLNQNNENLNKLNNQVNYLLAGWGIGLGASKVANESGKLIRYYFEMSRYLLVK